MRFTSHRLAALVAAAAIVPAVAQAADPAADGPRPSARESEPQAPRESARREVRDRLPYLEEFTCIAEHESGGRWDISTGNGYYGGLQMDRQFQQTYAPALYRRKGTADKWTKREQIRAAARAVTTRGFTPWPTTARTCGLL